MGIFNEHSSNQHPSSKGIQGAPGVGFNLTADGNYGMVGKKLKNVGAPESDTDSATKKYVDDNSGGGKTSLITVDSNIDMKNQFSITKLKTPSNNDDAANKKYVDDSKVDGSVFLKLDGTRSMVGELNMNNKRILNIPNPNGPKQATPLAYTDLAYLHVDGSNKMTNDLNMNNKKITYLKSPTNNSDAATKLFVDNKSIILYRRYIIRDGRYSMLGDLNMGGYKIINLEEPSSDNDAVNKKYMNNHTHTAQVQPSHYKDELSYLMSSASEWTDEITTGTSFIMKKIADLHQIKVTFMIIIIKLFIWK